jgi:hypothetical protein
MLLRRALMTAGLLVATPLLGVAHEHEHEQAGHPQPPAALVRLAREATRPFTDVNAATALGYGPFLGCVSGPDHGAMGVHYVNLGLYGDGQLDASTPEALIWAWRENPQGPFVDWNNHVSCAGQPSPSAPPDPGEDF